MTGQQTCPLYNIGSDVSIQRRLWQPLSVHLWAYCTHPTHDANDVWRLATPPPSTCPTFFEQWCGFFYVPQEPDKWKCCETGPTHGFSSLSEKTRKNNRSQMSIQRQHFLLSYLKTPSLGRGSNPWLPAQQTDALPTELTRLRVHLQYAGTPFLSK